MNSPEHAKERMLQLLADHATEGLDSTAEHELNDLLRLHPQYDQSHFEPAAAAIDLAIMPKVDAALPRILRDRVVSDAHQHFEGQGNQTPTLSDPMSSDHRLPRGQAWNSRSGWYVAAACLVLAAAGWWQRPVDKVSDDSVSTAYDDFRSNTKDLVLASWAGQEPGFEEVSGEVIWSNAKQRGFMRLVGLRPNDAKRAQYQLWIVDPSRDKHPIDGGVFDVRSSNEVIVPIDAKLQVDRPTVFAITREKPGGVVVSGGPLLVVGKVAS